MTALRAFEAASRHGSFKQAAIELSVTPAAISHQIKELEERLGAVLFVRLNRGLKLTRAGERLAQVTQEAFCRIAQTLGALAEDGLVAGSKDLRVSTAPSFGSKFLAPRLHRFRSTYPGLSMTLSAEESLRDVARDRGVDVVVRYGPGASNRSLHAEKLWSRVDIIAVCSPELRPHLAAAGLASLLTCDLLRTAQPGGLAGVGWCAWLAAAGLNTAEAEVVVERGTLFGTTQMAIEAAAAGRGIALAPAVLVAEDLKLGRLARPFAFRLADANAFWLIYRHASAGELRVRSFASWLREEALLATQDA